MHTLKYIQHLFLLALLLVLTACGGGGSTDGTTAAVDSGSSSSVISGQVADGYLSGARVFLDRNGNRILDNGEPWAYSGAGGNFSLDVVSGEGNLYPLVVDVLAGQTVDEDQPGSYVADSYQLETPAGHGSFVSPLTTLVKHEQDRNPSLSLAEAENRVRTQLGFSSGASFFANYIEVQDNAELASAHRAAQLIAALMGSLQTQIELNAGAANVETLRGAVDLLISDQIANHYAAIAQGIASATDATAVAGIRDAILSGIDTAALDAQLLARYVARMEYDDPVWDMTPPEVVAQSPQSAGSASTDVVVSLRFDEALNPTTIGATSVQLVGPGGTVSGSVSYDSDLKQLNFTPDHLLMAYTSYQVQVTGVEDGYGNVLNQAFSWDFTTIFDQLPPALPDF